MEISEDVNALYHFIQEQRTQGDGLSFAQADHVLDQLFSIHRRLVILEDSPALNKKVAPMDNHPAYLKNLKKTPPAPIKPMAPQSNILSFFKRRTT